MKKQAQPKKPTQEKKKKDQRSAKRIVVLNDLELKEVSGGRTVAAMFCTCPWD
ncbi:MAG: hypothetical protein IPG50_38455 [Myxococcales bacterium]|nr:hypothetical protein [Myxococcales bacterium]